MTHCRLLDVALLFIRFRLNIALTHQNRSYRDSENKEKVEAPKRKQRGGNDRKRTATTKKGRSSQSLSVSSLQPVRLKWPYQEHKSSSRLSLIVRSTKRTSPPTTTRCKPQGSIECCP